MIVFYFSSVKHIDAVAALGATGVIDIKQLTEWAEKAKLDPNDPANAFLLNVLKVSLVAADFFANNALSLILSPFFFIFLL